MKLLFEILVLLFLFENDNLKSIKDKLEKTSVSELPFEATKKVSWDKPAFAIIESERQDLPIFTYADLGLTKRNEYNEDVSIFRKFKSQYDNYSIVALEIGVSDPAKQLLVTYNSNGEVLDFLEAGVYWDTSARLCIKQWRITDKYEVIVSWIQVLSNKVFCFYDDFSSLRGQRFDTYYQILENGKFQKSKEIKFQPMVYTKTYLEGEKNLWEGTEIPLSE